MGRMTSPMPNRLDRRIKRINYAYNILAIVSVAKWRGVLLRVESRGGISPPRAHGSGHERRRSSGSYCPAPARCSKRQCAKSPGAWRAIRRIQCSERRRCRRRRLLNGFALSKRFLPSLVDHSIKLNNVAPSLQPHYRAFLTTTRDSAPVPRLGTLALVGQPLELLPSHRGDRFPRSTQKPESRSRRLHAGRRLGSTTGASQTYPGLTTTPRF